MAQNVGPPVPKPRFDFSSTADGEGLFAPQEIPAPLAALRDELRATDTSNMTPLQALAKLEELKRQIEQ